MGRIREIVFDCEYAPALARFWAQVLDGYQVRPYDDAEIARLAAKGLSPDTDPIVMVDGPGPTLCFQQVPGASMTITECISISRWPIAKWRSPGCARLELRCSGMPIATP